MNTYIRILICILCYCQLIGQAEQDEILVFSKTKGWRHSSITIGVKTIIDLGKQNNIKVTATENGSLFTDENLSKFNAVVFLNTSGDILSSKEEAAFERYIQNGGGYVGVHSASDSEYDWAWYGRMVGAYFVDHPQISEATLKVHNKNHLATAHLTNEWVHTDEWYNFKQLNFNVNVLLTIDEDSYEGGTNGTYHPMAWYHNYDGGRAFYTGLGHRIETWSEPQFRQHLLGGIFFAMDKKFHVDTSRANFQKDGAVQVNPQSFQLYKNFPSKYISVRDLEVWLPKEYNGKDPLPVLYMYDGQNMFHGTKGWDGEYSRGWAIDETLDSLTSASAVPPVIVVGLWNGGMKRMSEYMPAKPTTLVAQRIAKTTDDWCKDFKVNPPISDAYLKYLVEEVKSFIDANYKTKTDRANTYIGGSSMGGLMSIYTIGEYPEIFGGAACFSSHWPALDGVVVEYVKKHLPDPATHKIYFDYGTEGLDGGYEPYQKQVDFAMRKRGYEEGMNWMTKKYEGADHSEAAWRKRFDIPMKFLFGQLKVVKK